jgi:hypothetical protein
VEKCVLFAASAKCKTQRRVYFLETQAINNLPEKFYLPADIKSLGRTYKSKTIKKTAEIEGV